MAGLFAVMTVCATVLHQQHPGVCVEMHRPLPVEFSSHIKPSLCEMPEIAKYLAGDTQNSFDQKQPGVWKVQSTKVRCQFENDSHTYVLYNLDGESYKNYLDPAAPLYKRK